MKILATLGLVTVLGVGLGAGAAWLRMEFWRPWDGTPEGIQAHKEGQPPSEPVGPRPKVHIEVGENTHDFGVMESHEKGRHEFVVANVGQAPLTLRPGSKTCKCTVTIPEKNEVAPGESTKVAVEWSGKDNYLGQFTQTAKILTNDPRARQVKLTIRGRVTLAVRAVPPELTFTRITAGESASAEVRLFGFLPEFRKEPLAVTGYELLVPSGKEHFEVALEPLGADELKEEEDATGGVRAEVTVKPGLPVGRFDQKILFKTSSKDAPTIEVPVSGRITAEISVVGKGWNDKTGVLVLGRIRSRDGAARTVFLRAGGPYSKEVDFELIEKVPDLLEVTLGKRREDADGNITLTDLTIRVPKGSPSVDYWGAEQDKFGRITLKASWPTAPERPTARELRIFLRFAVAD